MPHRFLFAMPLLAGVIAAPALAQDPPPCEMSGSAQIAGTAGTMLELHAVRFGLDTEASIEGRYTLKLDAVSRADEAAPAQILVQVTHMETGTPDYGTTGFRKVVVSTPGITGTPNKGPQPTVELKSARTALGSNRVSPESDVLFLTSNSFVRPPPTAELMMGMDLDKRLNVPREGLDIQIVVRDKDGKQLGEYLLPGSTLKELRDELREGYAKLATAMDAGQCQPKATFLGY